MLSIEEQLEIIKRGAIELIPEDEFIKKLEKGKPLRIKWGADPSAPDIHLGHTVILNKLRQLQDLGHEVIFIVGDFTARIGDPTGKSETRKPLTKEEVESNARTYQEQIFKILDRNKTRVVFNNEWLSKMKIEEVINLAAKYTVARMLERDDFMNRFEKERPISIHEFLYPLLQGYDSVMVKADVEVGGSDQKFNMLVGRELQREYNEVPQIILTLPLLEGTDGIQKMSKSLGNYIGITEPPSEIYGKTMSISDELMERYYVLLTNFPVEEIKAMHPMEAKKKLARFLVTQFHNEAAAELVEKEFGAVFSEGKLPKDIPLEFIPPWENKYIIPATKLLVLLKLVESASEARRLIDQGGVRVNDRVLTDSLELIDYTEELLVNVGKRKFMRVVGKR